MVMAATTMFATVILPEGGVDTMTLPRDDDKRLAILQQIVGGYIEAIALPCRRYMVINENGKDGPHMINQTATALAHEAQSITPSDYIAGPAVIISQDVLQ